MYGHPSYINVSNPALSNKKGYMSALRAVPSLDRVYAEHVNPQWVRLLDLLQMNVRYERCAGAELLHRRRPPYSRFPFRLLRPQRRPQSSGDRRGAQRRTRPLRPGDAAEPRSGAGRRNWRSGSAQRAGGRSQGVFFCQLGQRRRGGGDQVLARAYTAAPACCTRTGPSTA